MPLTDNKGQSLIKLSSAFTEKARCVANSKQTRVLVHSRRNVMHAHEY